MRAKVGERAPWNKLTTLVIFSLSTFNSRRQQPPRWRPGLPTAERRDSEARQSANDIQMEILTTLIDNNVLLALQIPCMMERWSRERIRESRYVAAQDTVEEGRECAFAHLFVIRWAEANQDREQLLQKVPSTIPQSPDNPSKSANSQRPIDDATMRVLLKNTRGLPSISSWDICVMNGYL